MVFRIVLCFSVLNYGKLIYAYVISFVALGRLGTSGERVYCVKMADEEGNCVAAINHIRNVLFDILRQLESGNNSSDTLDQMCNTE